MCRLHTEGVQHGCGHYIVTDRLSKDDCCDQFCMNSDFHPEGRCSGCGETCKRYYDPDATQDVIDNTPAYCTLCDYWFKGAGAKREVNPVALAGAEVLLDTRPQPNSVPAGAEVLLNVRSSNSVSAGGAVPLKQHPQPQRRQIRQR